MNPHSLVTCALLFSASFAQAFPLFGFQVPVDNLSDKPVKQLNKRAGAWAPSSNGWNNSHFAQENHPFGSDSSQGAEKNASVSVYKYTTITNGSTQTILSTSTLTTLSTSTTSTANIDNVVTSESVANVNAKSTDDSSPDTTITIIVTLTSTGEQYSSTATSSSTGATVLSNYSVISTAAIPGSSSLSSAPSSSLNISSAVSNSASISQSTIHPETTSTQGAQPSSSSIRHASSTTSTSTSTSTSAASSAPAPSGLISGEATFYSPGLGACGGTNTDSDLIVALQSSIFDKTDVDGNPNKNTICGKKIRVHYQGKSVDVTVVDSCPTCSANGVDLSPKAFNLLANPDLGVLDVQWEFLN